jgi:murein DD-endopeptidase MepM/ murein hydrolase activator NlpD
MSAPAIKTHHYTVLVVSDHSQSVRKFRLQRASIRKGLYAAGAVALLGLGTAAHYLSLVSTSAENRLLKEENAQLRSQILLVQEKVAHISSTLDRVERFDAKLRSAVTQLKDPDRRLAVGPVQGPASGASKALPPAGSRDAGALPDHLEALAGTAMKQESSLRELQEYFEDQRSLLSSTPSVWPTRGWVTSDFGTRLDPYTAERVMHHGMDIASRTGEPVVTPSDGTVVFAGTENGYGKVLVVDHGYGVKTRYAHLAEIFVKAGERVKRGARIAAVGNTGRSTGPHLHYEVRVNGIPENPRKFILE